MNNSHEEGGNRLCSHVHSCHMLGSPRRLWPEVSHEDAMSWDQHLQQEGEGNENGQRPDCSFSWLLRGDWDGDWPFRRDRVGLTWPDIYILASISCWHGALEGQWGQEGQGFLQGLTAESQLKTAPPTAEATSLSLKLGSRYSVLVDIFWVCALLDSNLQLISKLFMTQKLLLGKCTMCTP